MAIRGVGGFRGEPSRRLAYPAVAGAVFAALVLTIIVGIGRRR